MNILEKNLWTYAFNIREKFIGKAKSDENFKKMKDEVELLYNRYLHTEAEIPARWVCQMLLEMFNEEYTIGGN